MQDCERLTFTFYIFFAQEGGGGGGVLLEILGGGVLHGSPNPDPV